MERRFRLLASRDKTVAPRQRTLRALIAWSYDLLSVQEKFVFEQLSVLLGDWTLDAAVVLATGDLIAEGEVFGVLGSLVDKSFIIADTSGAETTFRMLESMRDFGLEALKKSGDLDSARQRYAEYYLAALNALVQDSQAANVITKIYDNVAVALQWALGEGHSAETGCAAVLSLTTYWRLTNVREGLWWLEKAAAAAEGALLGKIDTERAIMAFYACDYEYAQRVAAALFDRAQRNNNEEEMVGARRVLLSIAMVVDSDYDTADTLIQANADYFERSGKQDSSVWFGVYGNFGQVALMRDKNYDLAIDYFTRAYDVIKDQDLFLAAHMKVNCGYAATLRGDFDAALAVFKDARAMYGQLVACDVDQQVDTYEIQVHLRTSEFQRARPLLRRTLSKLVRDQGDSEELCYALELVCWYAALQGNCDAFALNAYAAQGRAVRGWPHNAGWKATVEEALMQNLPDVSGAESAKHYRRGEALTRNQVIDLAWHALQ